MADVDIGAANITKIRIKEVSAPSNPSSGFMYLYGKSDGYFYAKDDGGTEHGPFALMTGDAGAGGTVGLVPAPGAGDAAAGKFLKADATWATAGASIDVDEDGGAVVTGADKFDFYDAFDVVDAGSNDASIYLKIHDLAGGRLTLESGVGVSASDQSAKTSVYYTPYKHNVISLYDGTRWRPYTFTERTLSVPATTDTNFDVFIYDNSGTITLEAVDWTNDTTRATALATQDGRLVKTGATGRRYIGTCRTTGTSGQTQDTLLSRLVWNYDNRVCREILQTCADNSWTYATLTWRQANASSANQIEAVVGVEEALINLWCLSSATASASVYGSIAIGEDSTSSPHASCHRQGGAYSTSGWYNFGVNLRITPSVGYHYYSWLEIASGSTITFYGGSGGSIYRGGLSGYIEG